MESGWGVRGKHADVESRYCCAQPLFLTVLCVFFPVLVLVPRQRVWFGVDSLGAKPAGGKHARDVITGAVCLLHLPPPRPCRSTVPSRCVLAALLCFVLALRVHLPG